MKTVLIRKWNFISAIKLLCISMFFWLIAIPKAYCQKGIPDSYAWLSVVEHDCGSGGILEFELNEKYGPYNFYWKHGPVAKRLESLAPGKYVFVVENIYGCVEEFEAEIVAIEACTLDYVVRQTGSCTATLIIDVLQDKYSLNGSAMEIQWSDGYAASLQRNFDTRKESRFCVSIKIGKRGDYCCELEKCFDFAGNLDCNIYNVESSECKLIVNEFGKGRNSKAGFVELLVVANTENCTCDLGGYILDDNNGALVPGNRRINKHNIRQIGIDKGFLVFQKTEAWSAVPNGSLIVVYDENNKPEAIGAEDPNDANRDNVYWVSASNGGCFTSKTGEWDKWHKVMTFSGNYNLPAWNRIAIDKEADGMQTRYPDGRFCHGVSFGENSYTAENEFSLWVGTGSSKKCNCHFKGFDFSIKDHYSCGKETGTPGAPNSEANGTLIRTLEDCALPDVVSRSIDNPANTGNERRQLTSLPEVFPNPFSDQITIRFEASVKKRVGVVIYDLNGKVKFSEKWICNKGENHRNLIPALPLQAAIYILEFCYPDGRKVHERVVRMKSE